MHLRLFYLELGITHLIPKIDLKPLPPWDFQSLELQMKHSHQSLKWERVPFLFKHFETACSALHERPPLPIWPPLSCHGFLATDDMAHVGLGAALFDQCPGARSWLGCPDMLGSSRGGALIAKASLLDVMMQLPHSMHNLKPICPSATL